MSMPRARSAARLVWTVASLGTGGAPLMALVTVVAGLGCVSSSIDRDVRRVRALTRVSALPEVVDRDVDPRARDDARRLLAQPLDADAAVRVALLDNRELRARLRELGIERGRLLQASVLPNPHVEAELLTGDESELELRVEYDITRALLTPARSDAAAPALEAARYRAAGAVVDLGVRVRRAFYGLQAALQRLAFAQRTLDAWAAARDAAQAMHDAGNLNDLELSGHDAAYQKQRVAVALLELEVAAAREQVQRLLGAHGAAASWRVRGELSAVPADLPALAKLETRALRSSLELKAHAQHVEGLARRAGFARAQGWVPEVVLGAQAVREDTDDAAVGDQDEWRWGAAIGVEIPLFDRDQGTATAFEAELEAELERYYGLAVEIRSAAREAASRIESAHARARQYQDVIVPAQRRVSEQTLLQYNAMQLGIFALLQARREQLDVELAYVDTLREYWSAAAELDALLAGHRPTPMGSGPAGMSATSPASSTPTDSSGGH
jgi:outer membrane protein TolC